MVTTYPLQAILYKPNLAGSLALWATELGAFNLKYVPQTTMKSQVIVNFIVEFSVASEKAGKKADVLGRNGVYL